MNGLVGFLVILALVVAAVLLFRSMSRHLRKVPASFDQTPTPPTGEAAPLPEQPPNEG
jgi:hypothetical protein